jgi:hypothetical protein
MAYVQIDQAQADSVVNVNIRDKLAKGKIASFPLYDPGKYGFKRKTAA